MHRRALPHMGDLARNGRGHCIWPGRWWEVRHKSCVLRRPNSRPSPKISKVVTLAGPIKKHCNCKNSRCLKLYCECFASGRYCDNCNCVNCCNNKESEQVRQAAVEAILERNPNAFRPKIQVRTYSAL